MNRNFIQAALESIAERGRGFLGLDRVTAPLHPADLVELSNALLTGRGEASGVALARQLLDVYEVAGADQRKGFIAALANGFGPDEARLDSAVQAYQEEKTQRTMAAVSAASEPKRQELIRRINRAPGGTAALVRLRQDVLAELRADDRLGVLDDDFVHLFSSWFNRGFLALKPISWTTPANILAKIIQYEAVHSIRSWDDLRNRLEPPDRRCFAFFHPQMGDEPLVFVEVALMKDMPDAIAPILDLDRETIRAEEATTAVFYSISNCQAGLKGVSFGNFLIKQVVEELRRDLPGLKAFVTLSPVPGFMAWLRSELESPALSLLAGADASRLEALLRPGWAADSETVEGLREAQMAAAATYFLAARTPAGQPVDPVARFHLGNGARLERINWRGDTSANGLKQAAGLMVNYLYDPETIVENHEAFARHGRVAVGAAVRKLHRHAGAIAPPPDPQPAIHRTPARSEVRSRP